MTERNLGSNSSLLNKYLSLPQPDEKCQVTYVWIDVTGQQVRDKTRTLDFSPQCIDDIPVWAFAVTGLGKLFFSFW